MYLTKSKASTDCATTRDSPKAAAATWTRPPRTSAQTGGQPFGPTSCNGTSDYVGDAGTGSDGQSQRSKDEGKK